MHIHVCYTGHSKAYCRCHASTMHLSCYGAANIITLLHSYKVADIVPEQGDCAIGHMISILTDCAIHRQKCFMDSTLALVQLKLLWTWCQVVPQRTSATLSEWSQYFWVYLAGYKTVVISFFCFLCVFKHLLFWCFTQSLTAPSFPFLFLPPPASTVQRAPLIDCNPALWQWCLVPQDTAFFQYYLTSVWSLWKLGI